MARKTTSLLINPRAGANTTKLQDILAVLYAGGWTVHVRLKEYGKHVMTMAREAARKEDLVIAYGGDGTLNQAVNGVMSVKGKRPAIGLIPGGTANVWAGEVGIPTDPVKAALAIINSDVRKVDVVRIAVQSIQFPDAEHVLAATKAGKKATDDSHKVRHHFLLMAGLGLDAAIMGGVSKPLKYHIGPYAVGVAAAQVLPSQQPFPIELQAGDTFWKGIALQVVLGNTRRYAKVQLITPNAYVDDGEVDVCVITAGNPLTTLQQISSLILRQKLDNTTAAYFKGAHIRIKVPASVPLQVDGSAVKLKDYLRSADYEKLKHFEHDTLTKVLITYQIDTLPKALSIAIPNMYDNELFEHAPAPAEDKKVEEQATTEMLDTQPKHGLFQHLKHEDDVSKNTASQQHTLAIESLPASELYNENGLAQEYKAEVGQTSSEAADVPLQAGRKVTVIGKVSDPAHAHTYVIAGTTQNSVGVNVPVAVVIDEKTSILNREGHLISNAIDQIGELAEGSVLLVDGPRSKHSVIKAKRAVLA